MQETIEAVWKAFQADLDSFPTDRREVDSLKSKYFGRNGALAKLFSQMGKIVPEERPGAGKYLTQNPRNSFILLRPRRKTLIIHCLVKRRELVRSIPSQKRSRR